MKVLNSQKRSVELVIESPTLKLKPKWNQTRLTYFAGMHFFYLCHSVMKASVNKYGKNPREVYTHKILCMKKCGHL